MSWSPFLARNLFSLPTLFLATAAPAVVGGAIYFNRPSNDSSHPVLHSQEGNAESEEPGSNTKEEIRNSPLEPQNPDRESRSRTAIMEQEAGQGGKAPGNGSGRKEITWKSTIQHLVSRKEREELGKRLRARWRERRTGGDEGG